MEHAPQTTPQKIHEPIYGPKCWGNIDFRHISDEWLPSHVQDLAAPLTVGSTNNPMIK
jgi:hypothetical protein